jgi:predicted ATPase
MYALSHVSLTLIHLGQLATVAVLADELVQLAEEKLSTFWKAYGMLLRGRGLSLEGKNHAAADLMEAGISAMRSTGATAYAPWYFSALAAAYAQSGRAEAGQRLAKDAIARISESGESWQEAEAYCIAAEVELALSPPNIAQAKAHFDRALVVARQQMAKPFELRVAEGLRSLSQSEANTRL